MASTTQDELSISSNTVEETIETTGSQKSRKISPVHEHCCTPTTEERLEKPGSQWIWCKHCPNYTVQSTTNMRLHLDRVHGINVNKITNSNIRTTATESIE